MPIAMTVDLPSPFMLCDWISQRVRKFLQQEDMWMIMPKSIRNGVVVRKETSIHLD